MKSTYYSAAWTESGFFFDCSHEHTTIGEANSCIPCAGGYVVAVESGALRPLTAEEGSEFLVINHAPHTGNLVEPEEIASDDGRCAVMIRIRVGDRWVWTTWMCYPTYAEASAQAGKDNKVVRFRATEYVALRKRTEPTSPLVIKAPRETIAAQREAGTFFEFISRFLSAWGFDHAPELPPDQIHSVVSPVGLIPIRCQEDGGLTSELDESTSIKETSKCFVRLT
jgi:hypothetical protein